MIFIDTNYFLRFLLRDDGKQYIIAKQFFLNASYSKHRLISSTLVFFEVSWVLRSVYKKDKRSLINTLIKLLSLGIDFERKGILQETLELFRDTSLELIDCYNIIFAKHNNIKTFQTFDKKLSREFKKISTN